ncbi:androgen-induced gene 1 protein-like, partial [Aphis craccivora]
MTAAAKTSIMDAVNKGVHLSGAVLFTYSLYYYYTYVNIPARLNPLDEAIGGKFKYLTFCNMITLPCVLAQLSHQSRLKE